MGQTRRRSAPERAAELIRSGASVESVSRETGLGVRIVRTIAEAVERQVGVERAQEDAEKIVDAALRKAEAEERRRECPCRLCRTGYGSVCYVAVIRSDVRGYMADCSNPRCPARLLYPRRTLEEAVAAFVGGRLLERPDYYRDDKGRAEFTFVQRLLKNFPKERVEAMGASCDVVERALMMNQWDRMVRDPAAEFDTKLMCRGCGERATLRRAVSPVTHTRTWWRVRCPGCGVGTRWSFPTKEAAVSAFDENDLERRPSVP